MYLWVASFCPEDLRAPPWVTALSQDVLAAFVAPLPWAPRWACDENLALASICLPPLESGRVPS